MKRAPNRNKMVGESVDKSAETEEEREERERKAKIERAIRRRYGAPYQVFIDSPNATEAEIAARTDAWTEA